MKCHVYDLEHYRDRKTLESAGYSKRAAERYIELKKERKHQDLVRKMIDQDLESISHVY